MRIRKIGSRKAVIGGVLVLVAIGAALGAFAASGRSDTPPAPPTFAALGNGNPVASLPSTVQEFVDRASPIIRMNPATASTRVFLLRSSMGPTALDAYAFANDTGQPCFFVPTEGGLCETTTQTSTPDFYWQVGGGNGGN